MYTLIDLQVEWQTTLASWNLSQDVAEVSSLLWQSKMSVSFPAQSNPPNRAGRLPSRKSESELVNGKAPIETASFK